MRPNQYMIWETDEDVITLRAVTTATRRYVFAEDDELSIEEMRGQMSMVPWLTVRKKGGGAYAINCAFIESAEWGDPR